MTLLDLIAVGYETINHVKKILHRGSSNQPDSLISHQEIQIMREKMRKEAWDLTDKNCSPDECINLTKEEYHSFIYKYARHYAIGNCHEQTKLAQIFIDINFPELKAIFFSLHEADHCFLFLVNDALQACLVDPWNGQVYSRDNFLTMPLDEEMTLKDIKFTGAAHGNMSPQTLKTLIAHLQTQFSC